MNLRPATVPSTTIASGLPRRARLVLLAGGLLAAATLAAVVSGVVRLPDLEGALTDLSDTLGPWWSKNASTRSRRGAVTPNRGPRVMTNRRPRRLPSVKLARSPPAAATQAMAIIAGRLMSPCAATTPPSTIAVSPGARRPMNAPVSANARAATSA